MSQVNSNFKFWGQLLNDLGADTSLKTSVKKRKPQNMLDWDLEDVLDTYPDLMEFFNSMSRQDWFLI